LNSLSIRLGQLGRREEGLAASEEAVQVYRELAAQWPQVYQHSLDQSLTLQAWLAGLDETTGMAQ
jgi:hypothetical protein